MKSGMKSPEIETDKPQHITRAWGQYAAARNNKTKRQMVLVIVTSKHPVRRWRTTASQVGRDSDRTLPPRRTLCRAILNSI
jgi:hypothetical protein